MICYGDEIVCQIAKKYFNQLLVLLFGIQKMSEGLNKK